MPPRSDGTFLLSGGHYSYTFHLPKSLAAGTHHLQLSVIGEPTIRILDFDVRKDAVAGDCATSVREFGPAPFEQSCRTLTGVASCPQHTRTRPTSESPHSRYGSQLNRHHGPL